MAARREYLYGLAPCYAALRAHRRKVFKVLFNQKLMDQPPSKGVLKELLHLSTSRGLNVKFQPSTRLDGVSGNRPHQNIVMEVSKLQYELYPTDDEDADNDAIQRFSVDRVPLFLALDQIQDPMNLGAVLRSALYFGVDRIVTTKKNSCSLTPTVSKASSGAMEWLQVYNIGNLERFLTTKSEEGWDVVGTTSPSDIDQSQPTSRKAENLYTMQVNKPTILVIGNEEIGVSSSALSVCNRLLTIPSQQTLPDGIDSLNVSVASGILLHQLSHNMCRIRSPSADLSEAITTTGGQAALNTSSMDSLSTMKSSPMDLIHNNLVAGPRAEKRYTPTNDDLTTDAIDEGLAGTSEECSTGIADTVYDTGDTLVANTDRLVTVCVATESSNSDRLPSMEPTKLTMLEARLRELNAVHHQPHTIEKNLAKGNVERKTNLSKGDVVRKTNLAKDFSTIYQ